MVVVEMTRWIVHQQTGSRCTQKSMQPHFSTTVVSLPLMVVWCHAAASFGAPPSTYYGSVVAVCTKRTAAGAARLRSGSLAFGSGSKWNRSDLSLFIWAETAHQMVRLAPCHSVPGDGRCQPAPSDLAHGASLGCPPRDTWRFTHSPGKTCFPAVAVANKPIAGTALQLAGWRQNPAREKVSNGPGPEC